MFRSALRVLLVSALAAAACTPTEPATAPATPPASAPAPAAAPSGVTAPTSPSAPGEAATAPSNAAPSGSQAVPATASAARAATAPHAASPLPEDGAVPEAAASPASGEVAIVDLHREGDRTLRERLDAELAAARAAGQHVVVLFTADWCTPCRAIKDLLTDSPPVGVAARSGRFVIIDVDEWRGPAHRLLPGTDPSKLPLLVRVGPQGEVVQQSYGTALGLLDEAVFATNLTRLIQGDEPVRPAYFDDREAQMVLARADVQRQRSRTAGVPPFVARVLSLTPGAGEGGLTRVRLRLDLHNHDSSRRWIVLPAWGAPPDGPVTVARRSNRRFAEHIRAGFTRFEGARTLDLLPVGGWGDASLDGWVVDVPPGTRELGVWLLASARFEGERLRFQKKVPYTLTVADASTHHPAVGPVGGGSLEVQVREGWKIDLTRVDGPAP